MSRKYGGVAGGIKYDRYRVTHPVQGTTELVAISGENAIMNACGEWGISWGLNASDCVSEKLGEAKKTFCRRCGFETYTAADGLCNRCREKVKRQKRDYFKHYPIRRERA